MSEREKSLFKVGTRGFSWSVSKAILWNKICREEKKCWYWKNFKSSGWMRLRCIRWMDKTIYNLSKVICWWGWKKGKERERQSEVKKVCWEIWLSLNNFFLMLFHSLSSASKWFYHHRRRRLSFRDNEGGVSESKNGNIKSPSSGNKQHKSDF